MVNGFTGEYFFLSNFYIAPVEYDGILYSSNEAAFQSAKVRVMKIREQFSQVSPSAAKRLGRRVVLRSDWEEVKDKVMEDCVRDKFTRNPELQKQLIATGTMELVEENTWNDTYWGVSHGRGKNMLGKILMKIRDEFNRNN